MLTSLSRRVGRKIARSIVVSIKLDQVARRGDGTHVPEPLVPPGAYSAMGGLLSTIEDLARWVAGMTAAWRDDAPAHPVDRWSRREMQEIARFVATDTTTGTGAGTVAVGYGYGNEKCE